MKTTTLLLLATLSFSAFAQYPQQHPCFDFDQAQLAAESQVKDFEKEYKKAEAKLRNVEERLEARMQTLNKLLAQRNAVSQDYNSIVNEQNSLRQNQQSLQQQSTRLNNEIAQNEQLRQYHTREAERTTDLNKRREHLRLSKQLEKENEKLIPQLSDINQTLNASSARLRNLDQQAGVKAQQLQTLNQQVEQEQRDSGIARLQQDRADLVKELSFAQQTYDQFNLRLVKANSHVEMCYGYLDLSVKYPTALQLSKQILNRGCNRYVPVNQGSQAGNQAQDELLQSMCSR
jgi:chromosome segregation ATPase